MDSRDHLRALPDGMTCTVCDKTVPADRTRLLARREDLSFVEVDCPACGSTTLDFIFPTGDTGGPAAAVVRGGHERGTTGAPPVTAADVRAMRAFLDSWAGDARSLVDRLEAGRLPSWDGQSIEGRPRA